jgi:hypothetical protein
MPGSDEVAGVHVFLVLSRAAQALERHAWASIEATGLGLTDFAVLEALYASQ